MPINERIRITYALPIAVIVAFMGVGSLWVSGQLVGTPSTTAVRTLLYYVIPLIVATIALVSLGQRQALRGLATKLPAVFTLGWYIIAAGVVLGTLFFFSIPQGQVVSPRGSTVGIYLAVTLTTALFEELLCRGTIQNVLVDRYGGSPAGVWQAILLSSGIFAVIHFANLIDKPYFVLGTLTQVIYTFCLATLIGVIYYVTKDLLVAVVLHAIFNFFGSITDIVTTSASQAVGQTDIPIGGMIIQILIMVPAVAIAHHIYRTRIASA
ncbi:MAG: CPBP family intramembrane metalloprotease [Actinomycetaceae bacterium]|nr:CPBP family intramembrane metalloprotease [Actinomycetaceae bacterium]